MIKTAERNDDVYPDNMGPIGEGDPEEASQDTSPDPAKVYLCEMCRFNVLNKEEERELALRVYHYNEREAADRLVVSNLRLVVKLSHEYRSPRNSLDLIQEGNIGLIRAVWKYNPYKGTKFSTYASFWIRAYILHYIMESWSIVKLCTTQNHRKLFYRLNREKDRLENMGILPTPEILAERLGMEAEEIESMEQRLSSSDIFLDYPAFEETEKSVIDLMETSENVEEVLLARERRDFVRSRIDELKQRLNEKEIFVLENRTIAEEPMTLQEIGTHLHISREGTRQIEKKLRQRLITAFRWSLTRGVPIEQRGFAKKQ